MKKWPENFIVSIHSKYGITPNMLTYTRIFAAPWLALLVSKSISGKSGVLVVVTLVLYFITISTDFFDGILARHISQTQSDAHDHGTGGMLDRLSDKILIIFCLIPFGLNIFTFLLILGESILAYEVINSPAHKKQATRAGKIKMLFQAFLIPVLVISRATNLLSIYFVFVFVVATILLTYASIYSHFMSNE